MNWNVYVKSRFYELPRNVRSLATWLNVEHADAVQEYELWLLDPDGETLSKRLKRCSRSKLQSLDAPLFEGDEEALIDKVQTQKRFIDRSVWKTEQALAHLVRDNVLTQIQYECIYLHDVLLWTFRKIGEETGCHKANAHTHYWLGIQNIRYYLRLDKPPKARVYPSEKVVMLRMHKDGYSYGEIGERFGLSLNAVYNVVKRSEGA